MLKALLIIYFSIGLLYALYAMGSLKHPFKMFFWNVLLGPVLLVVVMKDAITNKKIKIGD